MKRIQIYLTVKQRRELEFKQILDIATGVWANRDDIGSTEEYVRNLRKDTRLKRFGLDR